MRSIAVLVSLLSMGCAAKRVDTDLVGLSDGSSVEAQTPVDALRAAARSADPTVRAEALGALVRQPDGSFDALMIQRGFVDPAVSVQSHLVSVLLGQLDEVEVRNALTAVYQWPDTDPYIRARLAMHWTGPRPETPTLSSSEDWHQLPNALVDYVNGEDTLAVIWSSVEQGAIRVSAPFCLDMVQALPASPRPYLEGLSLAEEGVSSCLRYGAAVGRGNPNAPVWREGFSSDAMEAWDALDLVFSMPPEQWPTWTPRSVPAGVIKDASQLLRGPTESRLSAALKGESRDLAWVATKTTPALDEEAQVRVLELALQHEHQSVRAQAARQAGLLARSELVGALTPLLSDDRELVRIAAAGALYRIDLGNP